MKSIHSLVSAAAIAALIGCVDQNPTEVRTDGDEFPVIAKWSATMTPVGTSTVSGTLVGDQALGYHIRNVTFTINGTPNATYQWRIFRGNCATTTAGSATTPGLFLFATVQSYPDAVLDATGKATITRDIAGALDTLTAYSIRVRLGGGTTSTNYNGTNPLACGNLQFAPPG
jgi:hypothetical protein